MKRSLKILVALFALFIATTGFAENPQAKQDAAIPAQNTTSSQGAYQAAAYNYVGYLSVSVEGGGYLSIFYYTPDGTPSTFGVIGGATIEAKPNTTCVISAAQGCILDRVSGDTTIRAFQTSFVHVVAYKLNE